MNSNIIILQETDIMYFSIIVLLTLFKVNQAIIGFNCGSTDPAVSTYSLVDSGECYFHEKDLQISNTTIELLQLAELKISQII